MIIHMGSALWCDAHRRNGERERENKQRKKSYYNRLERRRNEDESEKLEKLTQSRWLMPVWKDEEDGEDEATRVSERLYKLAMSIASRLFEFWIFDLTHVSLERPSDKTARPSMTVCEC